MDDRPLTIRLAQGVAIGTSAWLSGAMSSVGLIFIPALQAPATSNNPQTSARQFQRMYTLGLRTQPPATLVTCVAFFYLSYRHYHQHLLPAPANAPAEWKLWMAGGFAVLAGIWPFIALEPTSRRVLEIAESGAVGEKGLWEEKKDVSGDKGEQAREVVREMGDEEEMDGLLRRWAVLNVARAVLPLVGTGIGLYTILA